VLSANIAGPVENQKTGNDLPGPAPNPDPKHIIGSWIEEYRRIVLKFGQEENKNNAEIVGEAVHPSSNQPV
jgi:hypothetical protein